MLLMSLWYFVSILAINDATTADGTTAPDDVTTAAPDDATFPTPSNTIPALPADGKFDTGVNLVTFQDHLADECIT